MALDVTLVLHELHCVRENEGGSEPYLWPVLLWIDDTTIQNPGDDVLGVKGPLLGEARVVLKEGMSAGETAAIPFPLGTRGVRFEEVSTFSYVLLVVALLDQDETPQAAMWAGCKAFSSELRTAIAERLLSLMAAAQHDDAELKRLIGEITSQVKAAVEAATWDALTGWEKTRVVLGRVAEAVSGVEQQREGLNFDDFVGSAFYFGKPAPARLELVLRSQNGSEEYRLTGSVDAQRTRIDLCQAQVDAVKEAQAAVDGLEAQRSAAQAAYRDASPQVKAAISRQIAQLNQDLDVAVVALDEARRALQTCRDRWAELPDIRSGSAVEGVVNRL